jgi:spermidine/putrescine transport system substrate-binding protein
MTDLDQRLTALPVTRRVFLQGSTMAGVAAFLAACGGGSTPSPTGAASTTPTEGATEEPTAAAIEGPLNFANWPAYIDLTEDESSSPTLVDFEAKYDITVNYQEEIEANEDFYATIAPQLSAGLDTGWDIIVLTDYMAARVVRAGWIERSARPPRRPRTPTSGTS